MKLGATYSHRGIDRLKLDPQEATTETLRLGLDILRLGVYWDEAQPSPRRFDFSAIKTLLDVFAAHKQAIMLTVGMKAPRWPEYYVPKWLDISSPLEAREPVLTFVETAVKRLQKYENIVAWQVENEPLDGSGPHKWRISPELLADEVALVRSLDSRPIHINIWGDNIVGSPQYETASRLADTVGIDIYYKQPAKEGYHGPNFNLIQFKVWQWRLRRRGLARPLWITELQAEPWEHDNSVKFSPDPPSMNPQILRSNLRRVSRLNPEVVLLWGLEYWLWQAQQGRPAMLEEVRQIMAEHHRNR